MFLFDFNQIWILLTDLFRSFQFQVSRKSVKWEPSWYTWAD